MLWKRKAGSPVGACASVLYARLAKAIEVNGRIRVEDLISGAAAIVGEAMIVAAGDFDPRQHKMAPGAWVFSTRVNRLFCDDKSLEDAPDTTIVGLLREHLFECGFTISDFPVLDALFAYFAAHSGKSEDWGKVPLSVPPVHHPDLMPLRVAYHSRTLVDESLAPLGDNRSERLHATTLTLARVLCATQGTLGRWVSTTLALETVNAMSKMAPMTDQVMARLVEAQQGDAAQERG